MRDFFDDQWPGIVVGASVVTTILGIAGLGLVVYVLLA